MPLLHTLNGRGCTRGTITIVHGIAAPRIVGRHDTFYCVVWWSAQTGRRPLGRAQKVRFTTPQTAARNQPACPLLKEIFRCAGQIAAPLGAPSFLIMGEARRKRLQVSTKSTETRSSPRRLRNSRCRSSILNGAGAASSSALEQRLLPLLHTPSGRGLSHDPG